MCEDGTNCNHTAAHTEYDKALKRAFWTDFQNRIRRSCNDLLPFARVWQHIQTVEHKALGLDHIALDDIVGSDGRYRDFDLTFLPRRRELDDRWVNVAQAHYEGIQLPPVRLYKVGEAYYVMDGNHRVSVARVLGLDSVQAAIVEIDPQNLIPDPNCKRSGYKLT
jgi:hypothetical protein